MERWETIVGHPIEPGHRAFENLLQTASAALKAIWRHLKQVNNDFISILSQQLFARVRNVPNLIIMIKLYHKQIKFCY